MILFILLLDCCELVRSQTAIVQCIEIEAGGEDLKLKDNCLLSSTISSFVDIY